MPRVHVRVAKEIFYRMLKFSYMYIGVADTRKKSRTLKTFIERVEFVIFFLILILPGSSLLFEHAVTSPARRIV